MSTDGEASHTIEASHSSSSSSSAAASGASFHFSPSASTAFGNASTSPLHSPTSPITSNGTSPLVTPDFQTAVAHKHLSPFAEGAPVSSLRPFAGRQVSFPTEGTQAGGTDDDVDRPRRVSNEPERTGAGAWPTSPLTSPADLWQPPSNRSTRASSDGVVQDGIGDAFERRAFVSPTSSVLSVRQGPTDYMTAKGNVTPSSISAALSPTSTTSQLPSLSPTFSSHLDSKSVGSPRGSPSILVTGFEPGLPESEILTFFKSLFPSTLVAQLLHDATARAGEGYAIVHFGEESDVIRALTLGQTNGSGLLLHGRPVRMSRVGSHHDMGNDSAMPSGLSTPYSSHDTRQSPFVSTTALDGSSAPLSPSAPQFSSTPLPSASRTSDAPSGPAMSRIVPPSANVPASSDPNNTTVFVGGLPACISEETLKSFFQHFGDITYCKIPPGKGCGFVQFVHRHDAEMAIAKMNDFPIHGKSRIRLSWGRSQGDKQIEHVRKLASALGVPFDAVWKMVQGQDSANGRPTARSLSHDVGAMPGRHDSASRRDAQSAAQRQSIRRELESSTSRSSSSGPYARVPQTNFMHGNGQPSLFMPLSPPPSGSSLGSFQQQQQHAQAHLQRQSQHPHGLNYNNVRHDGYSLDGGMRATRNDRYGYEFEPQFGQYSGNDYDAGFDDGFAPKHSAIESGMSQLSLDPSSYSNGLQGFAGHLPQAMYKDDSSRLYDSAHWGP